MVSEKLDVLDCEDGGVSHQRPPKIHSFRWVLVLGGTALLLLFGGRANWTFDLSSHGCGHLPGDVDYSDMAVGTLKWWSCGDAPNIRGAECGYLIVPTDYFNANAGVSKVALGRYRATKSPKKGMVLFNPGGPGGPGKPLATRAGASLQTLVGEDYDVVGFDPRGIGETEPSTKCFGPGQNFGFMRNTILDNGFDVGGNLSDPSLRSNLLKQQAAADAMYRTQYELCGRVLGDKLKYMSTSTVVRDIDFMTKAIEGEDALINFYGFSYGSILGQYLVNMLPDRVGRVVIDGIADAVAWSNEPNFKWYKTWLSSTEDAFEIFLEGCSKAGPSGCALAKDEDESPSKIRARIESFFDLLYDYPLPVPDPKLPGILTVGRARNYLFAGLQSPRTWPAVAKDLAQAMQGNGSVILASGMARLLYGDSERQAVSCNDAVPIRPADAASNEEIIDELLDDVKDVTRFAIGVVTTEQDSGCQYWPVDPPERFSGPWNHTLRSPMLIHSNLADPVTPISSGRLVKKLLGNSARLALREGPGHCSINLASLCTVYINRAYFADGTLPENEYLCKVDESPFPDAGQIRSFSEQERRLLDAIATVGDAVQSVTSSGFGL